MYLKSLSIKNYRKYGENLDNQTNKIDITEEYISKSSSLIVGKNNSGKSTIVKLLNTLQNTKAGSRNVFKYTDFNLKMLAAWYKDNILDKSEEEIRNIYNSKFPKLEFQLVFGIDDENDVITSFADVLILSGIKTVNTDVTQVNQEVAAVTINIKYEVADSQSFVEELVNLKLDYTAQEGQLLEYKKEVLYRQFLALFNSNYFILNFYPMGRDEPAKDFSFSSLLKVETIEANAVKNDKTLSQAFNKIVSTYKKNNNNDNKKISELVYGINNQVKSMVDDNITGILQRAVSSFASSIIYEYREENNNIPENQFGMGYTNLMVIIAKIVDYIELYSEKDINGSVNILCIEEPETYMHPQMQELFIKNISKAIATLLDKKQQLDTFQIIITTHSTHILNSKIQSGNTLNNISYLGQANGNNIIQNISDDAIITGRNIDEKTYEYIKKYLRLEFSDIFFADAVILVEGLSEETYLRYEIDKHLKLKNHHVKVYRIDGAYAHQFINLLEFIGVKTVIFTDLDLKRKNKTKSGKIIEKLSCNISDLNSQYSNSNECLTTNGTIQYFVKKEINDDKATYNIINSQLIKMLTNKEELQFVYENISVYSQGKINGYYATSFEEAIILTNAIDDGEKVYKKSLIKLLQYLHPKKKGFANLKESSDFAKNSYIYQVKLSDEKSKFSTGIVYLSVTDQEFNLKLPKYIELGLNSLCEYFGE